MKRGDIQFRGVASNMIPLLTAGLLVLSGEAEPSMALAGGALLVVAGAALAPGAGRQATEPDGVAGPKATAPEQGRAIRARSVGRAPEPQGST